MFRIRALLTSVASFICLTNIVHADQLSLYRLVKGVEGKQATAELNELLRTELSKNGFIKKPLDFDVSLTPLFSYDNNINGGNPEGELVLGALIITTDPKLKSEQGFVYGLSVTPQAQYSFGNGRHVIASASLSRTYAIQSNNAIATQSGSICSNNHITNWTFLNLCMSSSEQTKALSNIGSTVNTAELKHNFELYDGIYSSVGLKNYLVKFDEYKQQKVQLAMDTLLKDGSRLSFNLAAGEKVADKLAFEYGSMVRYSTKIGIKPVTFELGFDKKTGGKLLGFDRHDESVFYSVTFNLFNATSISLGRSITDSNIDFYDTDTPLFNVSFKSIY